VDERLEQLVSSLLYEGYALYPYTPEATKNATPTPFGIVYPPVYAAECAGAHDHLRMECVARVEADPTRPPMLTATLCYLEPDRRGHSAAERRVQLGPIAIGAGERAGERGDGWRFTVRSEAPGADDDGVVVRACVHNTTTVPSGLSRADALARSLISTHVVLELSNGVFVSPLEAGRTSVNIFPVLAAPDDRAVLGAGIVLPDHPRISEHSHGNLFDNTEIEEALVLHVHTLTEAERESAAARDRVVGEMLERALALGPEEIMGLHSGLTEVEPEALRTRGAAEVRGEQHAVLDGVRYDRGDTVVLRPGTDRDPYDRMLDGRRATIERIYVDYDDRVHIGVTVDDDPGQDLMRETGRYLFFFAGEVEPA
jgi:hypothetical protein